MSWSRPVPPPRLPTFWDEVHDGAWPVLINIAVVALILSLMSGCSPVGEGPQFGTVVEPYIGEEGGNPNPLTFWWYAGDANVLRGAIECAVDRVRDASCLPIDISVDAHHWVRNKTPAQMPPGLAGQTYSNTWTSTRIALLTTLDARQSCDVLVHEIVQHVLRKKHDDQHITPLFGISEPLLTDLCTVQDCECFNPEVPPDVHN